MTEADFKRLAAEGYNRVPLVPETFADLDTPLSIYLKPDTLGCPDLFCPDLLLLLSEEIAVLDKLTGKLHLVVFAGLTSPFTATRYHSLAIARSSLPDCLEVTGHGLDRRWRAYGCAPQEAGGRGRAVSPRIHTHRARPPPAG